MTINGRGAYVEIADLDALDREYSEADERETAMIAIKILNRSNNEKSGLWKYKLLLK